jgi:2-polyprenyl-3-methyl-5-hydroxy-6-metoxy-1,4-benzoquinol methylase
MEALSASDVWPSDGLEAVTKCPACQSTQREVELGGLVDNTFFCASGSWTMMRCKGCRGTYLDPRPCESAIHLAYKAYYTHAHEGLPRGWKELARRALDNTYRNLVFGTDKRPSFPMGWLFAHVTKRANRESIQRSDRGLGALPKGGRVLDFGCGSGAFLSFARELGWHPFGVEMDVNAASVVRSDGLNVLARSLAELDGKYEAFFDVITLSHVIEHLHQPAKEIQRCFRLLKPGGLLWIETPNVDSFGFKLFGRYWRGLEAPRHLVLFNEGSLGTLLRKAGFHDVERLPIQHPPRNLFLRSAMIRAGFPPEADPKKLPLSARLQLEAAMYEAKLRIVTDPACAEYLCMTATKR